jgi:hypothetical protein
MEIRSDLKSIEAALNRLVEYSEVFRGFEADWVHLKNSEDFRLVYSLDFNKKISLEKIYSDGRELAKGMAEVIIQFNDAHRFPQLRQFVSYFDNTWLFDVESFTNDLQVATDIYEQLEHTPWAMGEMLRLFEEQINYIPSIRHAVSALKETEIYKQESGIRSNATRTDMYGHVLRVVDSVGKMIERHPSTFLGKSEEDLRDHMLVSLQSNPIGTATGETYNKSGKTDILIRHENSNIFIGECKVWHGQSEYLKAIDQLLGYLTWRDKDAALILFVKNQDISNVIKTTQTAICEHPQYISHTSDGNDGWISCQLRAADSDSVFNIAIMTYHTPSS